MKTFQNLTDVVFLKEPGSKEDIQLGKGGFSQVKLISHRNDPFKKFALKIIKKNSNLNPQYVRREIEIHQHLEHQNIVKFKSFFEEENFFYLIMEYLPNGNLYDFNKKNEISLSQKIKLFHQICSAVGYLHEKQIMHRDLKMENILLDDQLNAKISDFGWSNYFSTEENRESLCGTYDYMAFEIFKGDPQTLKTDVWALGILLFELFHKYSPFGSRNMPDIIRKIKSPEEFLKFEDSKCPSSVQKLISKILKSDPEQRPSVQQVLQDQIFQDFITITINRNPSKDIQPNFNFSKKKKTEFLMVPHQNERQSQNEVNTTQSTIMEEKKKQLQKKQMPVSIEKKNYIINDPIKIDKKDSIERALKIKRRNFSESKRASHFFPERFSKNEKMNKNIYNFKEQNPKYFNEYEEPVDEVSAKLKKLKGELMVKNLKPELEFNKLIQKSPKRPQKNSHIPTAFQEW